MPNETKAISSGRLWASRILGIFAVLFLVMDGGLKLFKPPFVVQATAQLGYPESTIVGIGIALLLCTVLYVVPRTSVVGAVLLTGYLGGAVASNVRARNSLLNTLFPVLFGAVLWTALTLRDKRVQQVLFEGE